MLLSCIGSKNFETDKDHEDPAPEWATPAVTKISPPTGTVVDAGGVNGGSNMEHFVKADTDRL